jgi:hypothetical protein
LPITNSTKSPAVGVNIKSGGFAYLFNSQDLMQELVTLTTDFTICRYSGQWEIRDAMLRPIAGVYPRLDLIDVLSTYIWLLKNSA